MLTQNLSCILKLICIYRLFVFSTQKKKASFLYLAFWLCAWVLAPVLSPHFPPLSKESTLDPTTDTFSMHRTTTLSCSHSFAFYTTSQGLQVPQHKLFKASLAHATCAFGYLPYLLGIYHQGFGTAYFCYRLYCRKAQTRDHSECLQTLPVGTQPL